MDAASLGLMWVLAASLAFAGLDAARKHLTAHIPPLTLGLLLSLGMAPVFSAVALASAVQWPRPGYLGPALASLAFNLTGNILFLVALGRGPVSAVVPLLALAPAAGALVGVWLLGDVLTTRAWTGLALVPVGALFLHATPALLRTPWRLPLVLVAQPGSLPMLGTALAWGGGTAWDKLALRHAAVPTHAALQALGVVLLVGAWVLPREGRAVWRQAAQHRGVLLGAVAAACVAVLAQFQALTVVPVGVMEAVKRSLGMASSVVLGRLLFGERVTGLRVVAVALMAAGVVLMLA